MFHSNNPFLTVWFKPKVTIGKVLSGEVRFKFYIPIILAGLSESIGELKNNFGIIGLLLLMLVWTGVVYLIIGHLFPWIVMKTGKIWNGDLA